MPNMNVISRAVGGGSPAQGVWAVPSLAFTTNTEALFLNQAGNPVVIYPQPVGQITSSTFGSGFDGFAFKVRACFKVTTGGSSTAIISMYCNQVGTTITSGNKVATITSQSLATASASGFLEYTCIWDSVSLKLNGIQSGTFGTTAVSAIAGTTTGISIPALTNLNFSLTGNMGTGSITSTMYLTEFVIETV